MQRFQQPQTSEVMMEKRCGTCAKYNVRSCEEDRNATVRGMPDGLTGVLIRYSSEPWETCQYWEADTSEDPFGQSCPQCGMMCNDRQTDAPDSGHVVQKSDMIVCSHCGCYLVFRQGMELSVLTREEYAQLPMDVQRMLMAIRYMVFFPPRSK